MPALYRCSTNSLHVLVATPQLHPYQGDPCLNCCALQAQVAYAKCLQWTEVHTQLTMRCAPAVYAAPDWLSE